MIYLCFLNHDSGLLLQHRRQTKEKPRRTKKKTKWEDDKKNTETHHKYNLNVRFPKSSQKFHWFVFVFSCSVLIPFSSFLAYSLTKPGCYLESTFEIHRQKQNFNFKKDKYRSSLWFHLFLVKQRANSGKTNNRTKNMTAIKTKVQRNNETQPPQRRKTKHPN